MEVDGIMTGHHESRTIAMTGWKSCSFLVSKTKSIVNAKFYEIIWSWQRKASLHVTGRSLWRIIAINAETPHYWFVPPLTWNLIYVWFSSCVLEFDKLYITCTFATCSAAKFGKFLYGPNKRQILDIWIKILHWNTLLDIYCNGCFNHRGKFLFTQAYRFRGTVITVSEIGL